MPFFLNRPEPEDVVSKGADLGLTPETRVAMSYHYGHTMSSAYRQREKDYIEYQERSQ